MRHDARYIDNTIATVRNHQSADNPWPGWANALADAVEDERARATKLEAALERITEFPHRSVCTEAWDIAVGALGRIDVASREEA